MHRSVGVCYKTKSVIGHLGMPSICLDRIESQGTTRKLGLGQGDRKHCPPFSGPFGGSHRQLAFQYRTRRNRRAMECGICIGRDFQDEVAAQCRAFAGVRGDLRAGGKGEHSEDLPGFAEEGWEVRKMNRLWLVLKR